MQIIEQTDLGVRSAVLRFTKRGSNVTFVVIPMVQLGSPAFHAAVRKELESCDRIVVEGVGGHRQLRYGVRGGTSLKVFD